MSNENGPLLDHEVDGIQELDNKLPRWWVWLFVLTTVFAAVYLAYYHVVNAGPLQAEQYRREMAAAQPDTEATPATEGAVAAAPATEEPSTDAAVLAKGKQLFTVNCAVCHGPDGGGVIGPNLCDDTWLHGPTFADNLRTIREGVLAKGMISWKTILKPADIQAVGSYIYSLRGTTPTNPKAPEGVKAGS